MIRIGIVAHTSRVEQAKQLAADVRADFISIDNGMMGCDANHRAVQYHLAGMGSTWSVILEDDAIPVKGFRDQLEQALSVAPSPVASLYLGRKRPPHWQKRISTAVSRAEQTDASWIVGTHLLHAVGYAIRTTLIPHLLAYDSHHPADYHIGSWARSNNHPVSYTYPSLVNHLDGPTIVEHPDRQQRTPGRTAWLAGTRDTWTPKAVTL